MRTVTTYTAKDGTKTYKVRYKINRRSGSTTFSTPEDAEKFTLMIEKFGPAGALELIGEPTEPKRKASGPTVTQCVMEYISLRPNPGTRATYTGWLELHIKPTLGDIRINQLRRDDIQRWLNSQTGSTATIKRNHVLLSAALKEAALRGQLAGDPTLGVRIPRMPKNEQRAPLSPPFTRGEVELIRKAMAPRYQLLVEFLAATGCRIGEAAALTPGDIKIHSGQVHFGNTYSYHPGRGYALGNTKTEGSDRLIRVDKSLLERLDLSGEFVFTTAAGGRVKDNSFRAHHWKRALDNSGLPQHRRGHIHDLRHAHATWLLDAGLSLPAIQHRLGHADVMTTLGIYGHASVDSEERILRALD